MHVCACLCVRVCVRVCVPVCLAALIDCQTSNTGRQQTTYAPPPLPATFLPLHVHLYALRLYFHSVWLGKGEAKETGANVFLFSVFLLFALLIITAYFRASSRCRLQLTLLLGVAANSFMLLSMLWLPFFVCHPPPTCLPCSIYHPSLAQSSAALNSSRSFGKKYYFNLHVQCECLSFCVSLCVSMCAVCMCVFLTAF